MFTEEILERKLHFLCSVKVLFITFQNGQTQFENLAAFALLI